MSPAAQLAHAHFLRAAVVLHALGRVRHQLGQLIQAPEAWRTLRISSQWPKSITSISSTSSQKKPPCGSITNAAKL